ncbi:O-antigen ligase family protein [Patescibacteria group bacterium]|nr:O-antigen ligase family protein [Patescibacteria group bacterium]
MKKTNHKLFKIFLAIFIFLIPWQTRWIFYDWPLGEAVWQYGRLSLYLNVLFLFLAAVFFALANKKEMRLSRSKFFYFVFAYSIIVCFFSPAVSVSFYYLFLIYSAALFAYLVKFLPKLFAYRILLLSGLIQSFLAFYQLLTQKVTANKWLGMSEHLPEVLGNSVVDTGVGRLLRAYGSLPHPNMLGGFLFVVIFLAIYLWIDLYKRNEKKGWLNISKKKSFWELIFVVISVVIATYGLFASFSRSAILALILSFFSLFLINIFKKNWLIVTVIAKYAVIFVAVFLSFNMIVPDAWPARIEAQTQLEEKSINDRIDTLDQLGWDNYKNGFFGQGLGINTLYTLNNHEGLSTYNVQPIHNIFILMLAEVGIIGIFLLFNILRRIIKSANKVDVLSTSLVLGLIIIGMFDHYLWTAWTGWLLVALGLANLYKHNK